MNKLSVILSSLLVTLFASCNKGADRTKPTVVYVDSIAPTVQESDDDSHEEDEEEEYYPHICESEDGRVTIKSDICPGGGTAPDYWSEWTVVGNSGNKHVIKMDDGSYQSKIHTIRKSDGSVYYIVKCFGKASSSDGYEWLKAYKIVADTIQEVNVIDGGKAVEDSDFSINYFIPHWYQATRGAGYDWLFEYDKASKNLYVPITTDDMIITDRYYVWHFNGRRFVNKGEQPHKDMHPTLGRYYCLISYFTTKDYIVRIDSLATKELRYAAWKKPKTMSDKPDIVIRGGKTHEFDAGYDELSPCNDYRFVNQGIEYIANYCETEPAHDGIGRHRDYLLVRKNGKVILKQEIESNK